MLTFNERDFFTRKITFANFILAIVVMFIHSENIYLYENILPSIPNIEYFVSYSLGNLAVPTFFLMSSYLFYRNFHLKQLTGKLSRRAKSILIPYLVWNFLYFLLFYIITFFPNVHSFMTTEHFGISPNVIFNAIFFHQYNRIFWFMQQLIYFIILSPIIYYLMKRKWSILVVLIFLTAGIFYPVVPNNQYGIRLDMVVYWVLGCYLAIHTPAFFEERKPKNMAFLSFFICIIIITTRFFLEFINGNHFILTLFSPILLFANIPFLWFSLDLIIPSSTKWWMRISFFIYATHPLLIDAFQKIYAYLLPDSSFFCLSNYSVSVIFSFIFIIFSARFLIKHFPMLWNILNGNRTP